MKTNRLHNKSKQQKLSCKVSPKKEEKRTVMRNQPTNQPTKKEWPKNGNNIHNEKTSPGKTNKDYRVF